MIAEVTWAALTPFPAQEMTPNQAGPGTPPAPAGGAQWTTLTPITPDPPWDDPVLWATLIAHAPRFIRPRSEMQQLSKPQAFSMMGLIAEGELARDAYSWHQIAEMPGYDRCHALGRYAWLLVLDDDAYAEEIRSGRLAFGEVPA